jgi:predicted AAA+ superfamily ATPase
MNEIITQSAALLRQKLPEFKRFLFDEIHWSSKLIGIKGARGTGKTTLLLQWLKSLNTNNNEAAYFSLDDVYFTKYSLKETLVEFHSKGGKIVVLDKKYA